MVRAVEVEGLLQKYVEEDSLERADALYLLYTAGSEEVTKTFRARYGRSGTLSSVLEDLKTLGVDKVGSYEKAEDTDEHLSSVIENSFKRVCLDLVIKSAKARATALSQTAKEILYLVSVMRPESVEINSLRKFYKLSFQNILNDREFERALDELKGCYFIQYIIKRYGYFEFPPYFEDLLLELRDIIPRVEVKVLWPEKER